MNLIFTSAGDNTSFHKLWLSKDATYDVIVVYYGDDDDRFELYKSLTKDTIRRKGSKFQNFHYYYNNFALPYDRIFILDDDIVMSVADINKMFELSRQYDLDICQPSFAIADNSKISHKITEQAPGRILTYTNMIEVNTPLFKKDALDKFMKVYDPILIGWGIDLFYIQALGIREKAYAVIHIVSCINPKSFTKHIDRFELSLITNYSRRGDVWREFAKKNNLLSSYNYIEYSHIFIQPS